MKIVKLLIMGISLLAFQAVNSQTLTLAVEATFPKDQAEMVYEPLREWLERKTGMSIELELADNYYFYWRSARSEQPDFTLDASHVAAYRMQEKNYVPIARVQEDMTYHLISNFEPDEGQDIGEFLVGEGVVTLPNPNMGSILFDQWFTDLFLQPKKIVTALSWEDVIEQVFAQSANAAIIPSYLFDLYPNFISLKESDTMPGLTFLASPTVDPGIKKLFTDAVLTLGQDDESFDVIAELNTNGFKQVNMAEYEGLADLLTKLLY